MSPYRTPAKPKDLARRPRWWIARALTRIRRLFILKLFRVRPFYAAYRVAKMTQRQRWLKEIEDDHNTAESIANHCLKHLDAASESSEE